MRLHVSNGAAPHATVLTGVQMYLRFDEAIVHEINPGQAQNQCNLGYARQRDWREGLHIDPN